MRNVIAKPSQSVVHPQTLTVICHVPQAGWSSSSPESPPRPDIEGALFRNANTASKPLYVFG